MYVKSVEGTRTHSDYDRRRRYYAPAWSPDGRQIAVLRGLRGFSQDVLVVPAAAATSGSSAASPMRKDSGARSPGGPTGRPCSSAIRAPGSVRLVRLPISVLRRRR